MADLDTTSKRRSSVQLMRPSLAAQLLADATIGQGDRQHIGLMYSGILAAGAVAPTIQHLALTWMTSGQMTDVQWDWIGR